MKTIEINLSRLNYLLKLYNISMDDLLTKVSDGLKNPITKEDIYAQEIQINHLKRIDKIFNKGVAFYVNPRNLSENENASIFFRKSQFNSSLNFGATQIVNQFEEQKIALSAISKLADFSFQRKLETYTIADSPQKVANKIRQFMQLTPTKKPKQYLRQLIEKLADYEIFVFEFVETWNKKEKANLDGFYLSPNVIVLKRNQKFFQREIFTLAHELGHHLLNEEEIDEIDELSLMQQNTTQIERWCNDFAYYFLMGTYHQKLIDLNTTNNNYHDEIKAISEKTHLSKLSLYTKLLIENRISNTEYTTIKNYIESAIRKKIDAEKQQRELDKMNGIKSGGSVPKPILSPLFVDTMQSAYLSGVIDEREFCQRLKIKPKQITQYL